MTYDRHSIGQVVINLVENVFDGRQRRMVPALVEEEKEVAEVWLEFDVTAG